MALSFARELGACINLRALRIVAPPIQNVSLTHIGISDQSEEPGAESEDDSPVPGAWCE